MLKLVFLGTSAGVPTHERNVTAQALHFLPAGRDWYLVDCGDGTQQQILRAGWSLHHLAGICISHVHGDHCYGLPGLISTLAMFGRKRPLKIIAPQTVWAWLQATQQLTGMYMPFELEFTDVESLEKQPMSLLPDAASTQLMLSTHPQRHRVPSHAFRFELHHPETRLDSEALKRIGLPPGPDWGRLRHGQDVSFEGRLIASRDVVRHQVHRIAVVIGGDNESPELLRSACEDAQLLVHEATFTQAAQDRVGAGRMHSSARDVASFAQEIGVPNLILTHFSLRHHTKVEQGVLLAEAQQHYRGTVFLARDLKCYRLDADGRLRLEAAD